MCAITPAADRSRPNTVPDRQDCGSQKVQQTSEKAACQWSRVGVSLYMVSERGRPRTSHTKVSWGAAPRPTPRRTRGLPRREPLRRSPRCRPLLPTSSCHGDIKDASNGASGGGCAHPRTFVAAQPRLHHARLSARHLAERQHGAMLWLAFDAARSCRRVPAVT
jgi:hypothetical protein